MRSPISEGRPEMRCSRPRLESHMAPQPTTARPCASSGGTWRITRRPHRTRRTGSARVARPRSQSRMNANRSPTGPATSNQTAQARTMATATRKSPRPSRRWAGSMLAGGGGLFADRAGHPAGGAGGADPQAAQAHAEGLERCGDGVQAAALGRGRWSFRLAAFFAAFFAVFWRGVCPWRRRVCGAPRGRCSCEPRRLCGRYRPIRRSSWPSCPIRYRPHAERSRAEGNCGSG